MNLYFYGGSFNPPHLGHKKIVNYFLDKCDKFLIIPTYRSPLKNIKPIPYHIRKKMLELMFDKELLKKIYFSDYELSNEIKYTIDTLKFIKSKYPSATIHMIIGADQLNQIERWKEYKYILSNVNLIVVSRPDTNYKKQNFEYEYINEISINISSSFIRKNINNIELIKPLLDDRVCDYIIKKNLYT